MTADMPFFVAVAAGMIRAATPVLFAAVGECITERSGILNLGLEGAMLCGALSAVAVACLTNNAWLGVLAALMAGILVGFFHALICIRYKANQVAVGIAMTILLSGITAYLGADFVGKPTASLSVFKLPLLGDIPCIGPIFFNQDPLVYICYLVVPLAYFLIRQTAFGLSLRACGEDPRAAAASGVSVAKIRLFSTLLGSSLAALGGAYLSLVYAQGWTENITVGRGWIALGLVMFAAWNPYRAQLGAYLFGLAISLQLRLQANGSDVSPYLLGMLPYLIVIFAMALSGAVSAKRPGSVPSALGVPYVEQS